MCRNEIIIMMERERVLSWPELCLTGSWPALPLATLLLLLLFIFKNFLFAFGFCFMFEF